MSRPTLRLAVFILLAIPTAAQAEPWTIDDVINSEEATSFRISPDNRWVVWVKKVADKDKNARVGHLVLSSLTEAKEIRLTRGSDNCTEPKWSPDGQRVAFLSNRDPDGKGSKDDTTQLWLINPFGGEPWPLTRRPRGIVKFEWAGPDTLIFAARDPGKEKDEDEDDNTIVVEDEEREAPVRLFELSVKTKDVKCLTQNTDRIQDFALSPDGRRAVTFHERSLRYEYDNAIRPLYFLYDLKSGERQAIFEERKFNLGKVRWARDGKGFYASSDFTTDPRYVMAIVTELYYFDLAAGKPAKIDLDWEKGLASQWENDDAPGFLLTEDGFVALLANGVRNTVARYTRQGNTWRRAELVGEHADHLFGFEIGSDGSTVVYAYSTAQVPTQWYRARLDGEKLRGPVALTSLNEPLKNRPKAKVEVLRWKGARDEEVEGLLYYPHEYRAGKKFPLVVMLHGGPALADFDVWYETWSHPHNLLAARGAFVFEVNYHGSSNYGLKWAESIAGKYLDLEVPDIEKGVDALIERGLADPERLGIMGWSNGGILTADILTRTTRYKAASVMAATVEQASDWGSTKYGAAFDQYYLGDTPFKSPALYVRKSAFYRMDKVRTPTILFCGADDPIVGVQQSWLSYRALQQNGKVPVRFLIFPGEGHGLEQLTHQRRKVKEELAWFDKYLFAPVEEKK